MSWGEFRNLHPNPGICTADTPHAESTVAPHREVIRDELIPNAVRWYTGEIAEEEDEEGEEGDDEEDDEDEDEDDEEDSEEDEEEVRLLLGYASTTSALI